MQLDNVRRIVVEDFPKEQRETVEKLADVLNNFMDQVVELSRNQVDYQNLARTKIFYDVVVDAEGRPLANNNVINTQLSSYSGKVILDAYSVNNGADRVISPVWLECQYQGNGFVRVLRVFGLPVNKKMRVVIEFIA